MENNEIMTNEMDAVVPVVEDVVETGCGKGLKMAGGVVMTVVIGGLAYKYVVRPLVGKIKDKRATKRQYDAAVDGEIIDVECDHVDEEE